MACLWLLPGLPHLTWPGEGLPGTGLSQWEEGTPGSCLHAVLFSRTLGSGKSPAVSRQSMTVPRKLSGRRPGVGSGADWEGQKWERDVSSLTIRAHHTGCPLLCSDTTQRTHTTAAQHQHTYTCTAHTNHIPHTQHIHHTHPAHTTGIEHTHHTPYTYKDIQHTARSQPTHTHRIAHVHAQPVPCTSRLQAVGTGARCAQWLYLPALDAAMGMGALPTQPLVLTQTRPSSPAAHT